MNNDYFNYKKCIDDLTLVLSYGYFHKYSFKVIEKRIIESKYFSLFNSSFLESKSYINDVELLKEIYFDSKMDEYNFSYNEIEWISTMYVYLISKTNYNFETLFIYIPLKEALKMYKLYHELDLNDSLIYFNELQNKSSIIDMCIKVYKLSNKEVADRVGLSSSTIDALRNRRRDIKKVDIYHALKLANVLKINISTLLNN